MSLKYQQLLCINVRISLHLEQLVILALDAASHCVSMLNFSASMSPGTKNGSGLYPGKSSSHPQPSALTTFAHFGQCSSTMQIVAGHYIQLTVSSGTSTIKAHNESSADYHCCNYALFCFQTAPKCFAATVTFLNEVSNLTLTNPSLLRLTCLSRKASCSRFSSDR